MPGYLIQSLNSTIDLMIQQKYKNWIEVWRFFVRTLLLCQILFRNLLSVRNLSIRSLLSIRMLLLLCVRNLLLSVWFPSEIIFLSDFPPKSPYFCQVSLRNFLLSVINLLLSVRFPSEISFFLSEISFPSGFPQKFSFCEVSFRNLLSVSFPLEISFFLSEVRNILLSVRFSSDISFFLSDISFLSGFPQKSPAFLELK